MEADWEVEIAAEAPVIDALWPGLVDLRSQPLRIGEIAEVQQCPALGPALLRLNGWQPGEARRSESRFWTAKCDVWTPDTIDPDELEAGPAESLAAQACYVDLIPEDPPRFHSPSALEALARAIVAHLRNIPLRCCRADLILRRALAGTNDGFGITGYITACGPTPAAAGRNLGTALITLAEAVSVLASS